MSEPTLAIRAWAVAHLLRDALHLPSPVSVDIRDTEFDRGVEMWLHAAAEVGSWAQYFDVPVWVADKRTFVEVAATFIYYDVTCVVTAHMTHSRAFRMLRNNNQELTSAGVQVDSRALSAPDSVAATG